MPKKQTTDLVPIDSLFCKVSDLIEKSKQKAVSQAKSAVMILFWQVGKRINEDILKNNRAEYGKQVVSRLSEKLVHNYGRNFELRNLRRMMQFAEQFESKQTVSTLSTQLSWSQIIELLPLPKASKIPINTFMDPYVFDFFGLKTAFYEKDIEEAVLRDLESFILELGKGFAFVERQKRMIIDGDDFHLDLLFYHRKLKRLVAIELKIGKFKAEYKGQMELYLKWLNRFERQPDENEPIGLILCAGDSRERIELLDMAKDGIMVAEYWTELPPKEELENKIRVLLHEARERIEARKLLEGAN